jgi:hypothetical protein
MFNKSRIIFLALATLAQGCNSNTSLKQDPTNTYEETKTSLKEKELQNPVSFLASTGTYRKNLIGEWVIEVGITNSATVATYKDFEIAIQFYSKTETLLGVKTQTIYEYLKAGETKNFKLKSAGYRDAKTISWNITGAAASE